MATYSGTPATWTAGQTVTASDLNAEVRDPLAALTGAWNAYTPTVTQSSAVTTTVTNADYIRIGKLVIANFVLTATAAGTAGSWVLVSLPVTAANSQAYIGSGGIYDLSTTTHYPAILAAYSGATQVSFRRTDATSGSPQSWGSDPNLALASGDLLSGFVIYEAA